ncbi:MAG: tail fiber domain-containing protein [Bacteroides sp.]|nr:tail fiber domain-containing protein [Bacteroides sp.]MCM1550877.1 tail fiber domain-containing protein [Clostridium sp.]
MNLLMQEITLDLNDSKSYEYMYTKQYDEGRQVTFHILDNGQPFDSTGYQAIFQMKKPDGTVILNDYDINEGSFTITLTNQMTICPGSRIPFQIQLIKVSEDTEAAPVVLTTVTGYLKVAESVVQPEDVSSTDEFNALTHAFIRVEELNIEITRAEEIRQENEETRQKNEGTRISNEKNRQTEETSRQSNETIRMNAEDTRCRNEETRQSNENIRNSNEAVRQKDTADAITKSTTATMDCMNATTDLQQKLSEHHFVLTSDKGIGGGVAELDENGLVPSSQLPGYVDDVLEGYLAAGSFYSNPEHTGELPGEAGKIYVDLETNKTYRWSGRSYIVISETLALGDTSSTAYRGDKGKTAYEHSQREHARTDATKVEPSANNGAIRINDAEASVYVHPDSGAATGSYGDASDQSPAAGEAFKVPYMTVDAMGHVTEVSEHTVTLPTTSVIVDDALSEESTNPVENKAVTQAVTYSGEYITDCNVSDGSMVVEGGTSVSSKTLLKTIMQSVQTVLEKIIGGIGTLTTTVNNKQDKITGAATSITSNNLTASRALISSSSGKVAVSSTTSTELGYVHGVTSAIQTQINNKQNAITTYLPFSNGANLTAQGNQALWIRASDENYGIYLGVNSNAWVLCPETSTNGLRLGNAQHPWRCINLENAPIVSSDRNKKEHIRYLEDGDIYEKLFMKLLPCSFAYKNTKESLNHDRTHIGFIAQDVEAAMEELGLTSLDFAGFCKDQKTTSKVIKTTILDKETGEEKEVEQIVEEKIDGEYIYSLRYQEFIALITKVLQKSCKRLNDLEYRISKLETIR